NGLEVVGKRLEDATVVVAGLGPSGVATVRILVAAGVGEVLACNREGSVHAGRTDLGPDLAWIGERTNPDRRGGAGRTVDVRRRAGPGPRGALRLQRTARPQRGGGGARGGGGLRRGAAGGRGPLAGGRCRLAPARGAGLKPKRGRSYAIPAPSRHSWS